MELRHESREMETHYVMNRASTEGADHLYNAALCNQHCSKLSAIHNFTVPIMNIVWQLT